MKEMDPALSSTVETIKWGGKCHVKRRVIDAPPPIGPVPEPLVAAILQAHQICGSLRRRRREGQSEIDWKEEWTKWRGEENQWVQYELRREQMYLE